MRLQECDFFGAILILETAVYSSSGVPHKPVAASSRSESCCYPSWHGNGTWATAPSFVHDDPEVEREVVNKTICSPQLTQNPETKLAVHTVRSWKLHRGGIVQPN